MSNQLRLNAAINELESVGAIVGGLRGAANFTEGLDLSMIRTGLGSALHPSVTRRALPAFAVAGAGGAGAAGAGGVTALGVLNALGAAGSVISGVLMAGEFLRGLGDDQPSQAVDAAAQEQSEHEGKVTQCKQSTDHAVSCMEAMDNTCVSNIEQIASTTSNLVKVIRGVLGNGAGPLVIIEPILQKAVAAISGILQQRNSSLEGCMDALIGDHQEAAQPGNSGSPVCKGSAESADAVTTKPCAPQAMEQPVENVTPTAPSAPTTPPTPVADCPEPTQPVHKATTMPATSGPTPPVQPPTSAPQAPVTSHTPHTPTTQVPFAPGSSSPSVPVGGTELSSVNPSQNCPPPIPTSQDIQQHIHKGIQQSIGQASQMWDQFAGTVNDVLCPTESTVDEFTTEQSPQAPEPVVDSVPDPAPAPAPAPAPDPATHPVTAPDDLCPEETPVQDEGEECDKDKEAVSNNEDPCDDAADEQPDEVVNEPAEKPVQEVAEQQPGKGMAPETDVEDKPQPKASEGFDKSAHPSVPAGAVEQPAPPAVENPPTAPDPATTPVPEAVEPNAAVAPVDPQEDPADGTGKGAGSEKDPNWTPDIWVSGVGDAGNVDVDVTYVHQGDESVSVAAANESNHTLQRSGRW